MPVARQLCRASHSIAVQSFVVSCPVCGRKVTTTQHNWVTQEGIRELRPVIPAHISDPSGEMRVRLAADKMRYPH